MKKNVYLDYAAAAKPTSRALKAFTQGMRLYGNPSAPHQDGREARALLEEARVSIAHAAGAKPEHLIFTSGATEANALALMGFVRAKVREGVMPESLHLLYVEGAHASIQGAMNMLSSEGVQVEVLPLKNGDIDLGALKGMLRKETALVSLEAISSETGARFDTRGVREVLDTYKNEQGTARIYLHVDASQVPFVESYERTRFGADLLTLDAQKVGGVRGIGALIRAPYTPCAPLIPGGGQERGLRSGTESPALAHAFATALQEAGEKRAGFVRTATTLRTWLIDAVRSTIANAYVNEGAKNSPAIVTFSFLGRDTDYLQTLLDRDGFSVSTKSACETDSEEGARGVYALTRDKERAQATLRISFGPHTKKSDVRAFYNALRARIAFIDQNPV